MTLVLKPVNEHYLTDYETHFCCDEVQFKHYCEPHFEFMGCYFCEFNYAEDCEDQH